MTDTVSETEVIFEVWQDGDMVAAADSLADAQHFMAVYGQDGPVEAKTATTTRLPGFNVVTAMLAASPQEAVPTKREAALAELAKLDGETMDLAASPQGEGLTVDALAQEIRRVDGGNTLGAGALAEALMPFLASPQGGGLSASPIPTAREVRLVLAARSVAFGGHFSPNAIKELDAASEAYAADVPWDEEPAGDCVCVQHGDGPEGCGLCNETGVATPPAMSADHIGDPTNMIAPVEAVAWRVRRRKEDAGFGRPQVFTTDDASEADLKQWRVNGYDVQPLFTHPAPIKTSADTGELRKRVAQIIGEAVNRRAPGQIVFSTLEDADAILDLIQSERAGWSAWPGTSSSPPQPWPYPS